MPKTLQSLDIVKLLYTNIQNATIRQRRLLPF